MLEYILPSVVIAYGLMLLLFPKKKFIEGNFTEEKIKKARVQGALITLGGVFFLVLAIF